MTYNISTVGIADTWYKKLFKRNPDELQWTDVEDERFINWMKTGSLSSFPKLYGVINNDLVVGDWDMVIENKFNPIRYGGQKKVMISTAGVIGAKKLAPAVLFIVLGSFLVVLGVIF